MRFLLSSLVAGTALASPLLERQFLPMVKTTNGTVIGSTSSGIDSFLGIPFASPPVGNLRLKPPQPVSAAYNYRPAVQQAKSCPQFASQVNSSDPSSVQSASILDSPAFQTIANAGEDCLTLNIQRPSSATANSKLPVVLWIFGGGFELGSTGTYDGSAIISKSVNLGVPIIFAAVNYRTGGFGFLAGSDLANEHSTNLGLRDQRLGLEWLADNIAAFGGDPTKVTIWGESAGSISVFDQTVINSGDNTYKGNALFRGAIMNSGSIVPVDPVTAPQAQAIYDSVVTAGGCSNATDKLACLRGLDYQTFLTAASSVPSIVSYRSLDLSYVPRPDPGDPFFPLSPELLVLDGSVAKVPIIIGDLLDEGTLFAQVQSNLTTNDDVVQYLATYFPNDPNAVADIAGLLTHYPDQPDQGQPAGSPYGTGSQYNTYPQFKRLAAVLGDIVFTLTRRAYLDIITAQGVPAWSYLGTFLSNGSSLQSGVGTPHGSDVVFYFSSALASLSPGVTFQTAYVSFINHLDPNAIPQTTAWPQYSSDTRQIIDVGQDNNTIITDDFRQDAEQYLVEHVTSFRA